MKRKTLKISILTIILVLFVQLTSFAALGKLILNIKTDKDTYKVGEKVTVTVDWSKEVESAGFVLKYDKDKISFSSTTLGANYYNAETAGKILFNWAAFDGKPITKVSFILEAKSEGNTTITIEEARGFADGDLEQATGYEYNNKTITILKEQENITGGSNKTEEDVNIPTTDTENKDNPTVEGTNKEEAKPSNKVEDSTTSKDDKIPQTGAETTILFLMMLVITLGITGVIGYRRLSDI